MFVESALKLIEIDKQMIPKMASWEIAVLSNLVGNFSLKFWEKTLKEFDEVRISEYKNKYSQKDIESDTTRLGNRPTEYRIKKKILEAGGKIENNVRTFFNRKYKEINLEEFYKI